MLIHQILHVGSIPIHGGCMVVYDMFFWIYSFSFGCRFLKPLWNDLLKFDRVHLFNPANHPYLFSPWGGRWDAQRGGACRCIIKSWMICENESHLILHCSYSLFKAYKLSAYIYAHVTWSYILHMFFPLLPLIFGNPFRMTEKSSWK